MTNGVLAGSVTSLEGAITNNSLVIFTGFGSGTYSGAMSGSGALVMSGSGTVTMSGTNSYVGGTLVGGGGGTLAGNTASLQGPITNNAFVIFNQVTSGTYSGAMSGTGVLSKNGAGTLTMSGVNSYAGGTIVSDGALAGTSASIQGAISNNALVIFSDAGNGSYSGNMGGSGAVTMNGTGTLTMSGSNSYAGGTLVTNGTLAGTTAAIQGAISNNGQVIFSDAGNGSYSGNMSGAGALTMSGSGTVTMTGTNNYAGGTLVSAGTLAGTTAALQGAITNNSAVSFTDSGDSVYSGDISGNGISGSGTLVMNGTGTVTMTSSNSHTGGT